jgi:hypothetical protein
LPCVLKKPDCAAGRKHRSARAASVSPIRHRCEASFEIARQLHAAALTTAAGIMGLPASVDRRKE